MRAVQNDSGSKSRIQPAEVELRGLGSALQQGLDLPLAALRASMEALRSTYSVDEPRRRIVDGALEEVGRLGRTVRDLMDLASPPVPRPLRCTVEEIVLGARNGLPSDKRGRVIFARVQPFSPIEVDGPLLGHNLLRLMENAVEAGAERVLVVVRQEGGTTRFSILDDAPGTFDTEWALSAFHSTKKNRLGLGLALSMRDVELLEGALDIRRSPKGETCAVVTVPDRVSLEAAA